MSNRATLPQEAPAPARGHAADVPSGRSWLAALCRWGPPLSVLLLVFSAAAVHKLFGPYTGDSLRYIALAQNLADGHGFSASPAEPYQPEIFRAPGYPLFLALLFKAGVPVTGVPLFQLALYALAIAIVYRLTVEHWDRLSGSLILLVLTTDLPILRWVTAITTESLVGVLVAGCAYIWVTFRRARTWPSAIGLALTLTALFFVRTQFIVLVLLVLIDCALLARRSSKVLAQTVAIVFIIAATIGPWMLRNVRLTGRATLSVGVGSGMVLWARGLEIEHGSGVVLDRLRYFDHPDMVAIHRGDNPVEAAAADARLRTTGWAMIQSHPFAYVTGVAYRLLVRNWVESESPDLPAAAVWGARGWAFILLLASYAGIVAFSTARAALRPVLLICLAVAAVHAAAGAIEARYTTPVRPLLYMFAAGLVSSWMARSPGHDRTPESRQASR